MKGNVIIIIFILFIAVLLFIGLITAKLTTAVLLSTIGVSLIVFVGFILALVDLRIGLIILLFSIMFSPEIPLVPVGGTMWITVRFEDFFLLAVLLSWFLRTIVKKEEPKISNPINKAILAVTVISLISSIRGSLMGMILVDPKRTFFIIMKQTQYFVIFWAVVANIKKEEDARKLIWLVIIFGFLLSVFGLIGGFFTPPSPVYGRYYELAKPIGEGENIMGGFFVFIFAIALGILSHAKLSVRQRRWLIVMIGSMAFAAVYVFSSETYIAGFTVFLVLGLIRNKALLFFIPLFILISGILPGPVRWELVDIVKQVEQVINGTAIPSQNPFALRVGSFEASINSAVKHPYLGYGWGRSDLGYYDNQYATTLESVGIIGLVLYLWLYFLILLMAWRVYRNNKTSLFSGYALGFLAGFFAMLVQLFAGPVLLAVRTSEIVWFSAGLLVVIDKLMAKKGLEKPVNRVESLGL